MASTSAAESSSAMEEYPNWLELPDELMANILQRLGTMEILDSARKVCPTWRIICNNPAMWKVINMEMCFGTSKGCYDPVRLTKQAVDLSCGELLDISIMGFGSDELLDYIVLGSSKLKRLFLGGYDSHITGSGLSRAVKMVPQPEELHIYIILTNVEDIEVIGQSCPQLKFFKLDTMLCESSRSCDDNALAIVNNMPDLRHLEVHDEEMTNDGLEAILNGCPHLQSLDVRGCYNLNLDGYLGKLCMERIKDFKFSPIHYDLYEEDDIFAWDDSDWYYSD